MSEQKTDQAVALAYQQIIQAAHTYQPTSEQFQTTVSDVLTTLAYTIETDLVSRHANEMVRIARQHSETVLAAALAGLEIERRAQEK